MCYANSSLQVLYHCETFRNHILALKFKEPQDAKGPFNMLAEIHDLFKKIEESKKQVGTFNHKRFIHAIKKSNAVFDSDEHQDAHEFMNWMLDDLHEQLNKAGE